MAEIPLLEINRLKKHFPIRGGLMGGITAEVRAVDDLSFTIARGETLSLVGESGSGKSTVGRTILGLTAPSAGEIWLDGTRIDQLSRRRMRALRQRMQIIFQDPFSSLDPRFSVRESLAEPLDNFGLARGAARAARIHELLDQVQLPHAAADRRPHEFSGGQRQRIAIARALAPRPDLIICDEAVSALDVSVKAQIINLLADIQRNLGLAMLFISHDLAIVEHLTHRIAVMYLGEIVEIGTREAVFAGPRHPYTEALLSAVPMPDPGARHRRIVLSGDIPSPRNPPPGCRFHTRCPYAFDRCRSEAPKLRGPNHHQAACHLDRLPGSA
jgi:peptide/nickel transport system ATP-binding protein